LAPVGQDAGVADAGPQVTVVVGVDGAGRSRRLDQLAAAASGPVVRINAPLPGTLPALLAGAGAGPVLVDDPHRLTGDELTALAAAARSGVPVILARRPTIHSRELADLDEALAGRGRVEQLEPLDATGIARLLREVGGTEPPAVVLAASGGLPAIAVAVAQSPAGTVSPALVARVQRRLALVDPMVAGLARLLALTLGQDLGDAVLRLASELDGAGPVGFADAMRILRDEGLLVPGTESMVPAAAQALLHDLPAAQRRRCHEALAQALITVGADPVVAATQLRAARAFIPVAGGIYQAAGDRTRFSDPAAALGWYSDAVDAGAEPAGLAAGRAEASALLGLPVEVGSAVPAPAAMRLALVDGAVEAHQGRSDRSAEVLAALDPPGPVLAAPAQVATGRPSPASWADRDGPVGLRRLADAVRLAAADPVAAVPLLIEAAELIERNPPAVVLPDTPHALGALVATTAGDAASAEYLLDRAITGRVGGPLALDRHRLLLAWVRLRAGRYDTAVAELARLADAPLPGRERLLLAALSAGIARRSGDVARLRDAWTAVEPVLARRAVDLFTVELVEELLVAATRLRRPARIAPVLDTVDGIVERLGRPPAWVVTVGWIRVQLAVAAEDAAAVAVAAQGIAAVCGTLDARAGTRQRAQCAAARLWAEVLAGQVDPDAASTVAGELAEAELPWEGSRLVGQAAIRTTDPAAARRLLERARDLSSAEVAPAEGRAESQYGGLSEREVEVARMVLDGGTYREIGSRLFISPKTVEHHVARIRTKLGATSRAEFVAALREVLGDS
jgi:DNA-binding CsgD family transcriptional regulator